MTIMIFVESTSCLLVQLTEYVYLNKGNKLENISNISFQTKQIYCQVLFIYTRKNTTDL